MAVELVVGLEIVNEMLVGVAPTLFTDSDDHAAHGR